MPDEEPEFEITDTPIVEYQPRAASSSPFPLHQYPSTIYDFIYQDFEEFNRLVHELTWNERLSVNFLYALSHYPKVIYRMNKILFEQETSRFQPPRQIHDIGFIQNAFFVHKEFFRAMDRFEIRISQWQLFEITDKNVVVGIKFQTHRGQIHVLKQFRAAVRYAKKYGWRGNVQVFTCNFLAKLT